MPAEPASIQDQLFPNGQCTPNTGDVCQKLSKQMPEKVGKYSVQQIVSSGRFALVLWINKVAGKLPAVKRCYFEPENVHRVNFAPEASCARNRICVQDVADSTVVELNEIRGRRCQLAALERKVRCFRKKLATGENRKINGFSLAFIRTEPMIFL